MLGVGGMSSPRPKNGDVLFVKANNHPMDIVANLSGRMAQVRASSSVRERRWPNLLLSLTA